MAPIELYKPPDPRNPSDEEREASYNEIEHALVKVCGRKGYRRANDGEDELQGEKYQVFIGGEEGEEYPIVLIGFDCYSIVGSPWVEKRVRNHKLIAPQDIIDEVNLEVEKKREASKFGIASLPQT